MKYILLALSFLLISCSPSSSPVDLAIESKVFHYGNGTEPQGLDPHIVTGVPEHHLLLALCEGLTSSNPRGGESLPGSASSWKVSNDGKIWLITDEKNLPIKEKRFRSIVRTKNFPNNFIFIM